MRLSRKTSGLALALVVLATSGCPSGVTVALDPSSTVSQLKFRVADGNSGRDELPTFLLETCASIFGGSRGVYWQLEPTANPSSLGKLQYGHIAAGYAETRPARALKAPACYDRELRWQRGALLHGYDGWTRDRDRSECRKKEIRRIGSWPRPVLGKLPSRIWQYGGIMCCPLRKLCTGPFKSCSQGALVVGVRDDKWD